MFVAQVDDVAKFLVEHPEYEKTLEKAISHETIQAPLNKHYLGWAWYDVGTMGAKIVRLVTNDIARINFKSNSQTYYLLNNKEEVREGLRKFQLGKIRIDFTKKLKI